MDAYIYSNDSANGSTSYTGAIAGRNEGTIRRCANLKSKEDSQIYAYVNTTVSSTHGPVVGGIAGQSSGLISECYNTGDIVGYSQGHNQRSCRVGGITGLQLLGTSIEFCYNLGNLSATGAIYIMVGGITSDNYGTLSNSYSSCNITITSASYLYSCGISGRNWENRNATITDSYYETKSNITYAYNISNGSSWKSGLNKSADELQSTEMINLLNANSDYDYYCYDTEKINNGYPILKWQIE